MPSTCYIIEQGTYSDYRVVGIFTTRENAEVAVTFMKVGEYEYDKPTITERILNPCIDQLNQGLFQYQVGWCNRSRGEPVDVRLDNDIDSFDHHWPNGDLYAVWAKDEPSAIKIAAERDAQYHATKQGLT